MTMPRVVDRGHQRSAPGDALLGVLGPVLHDLFRGHVVGHGHGWRPSDRRRSISEANRSATSSSVTAVKPGGGDRGHQRVDAPDQVGPAGGRVLVGRLVQRLDGQLHGIVAGHPVPVAELDGGAGVAPARPGGVVLGLLVVPAGDVVGEDPARPPGQVVAGEERHHRQTLHGHGQVLAHHLAELVGLPLEAEDHPFDLLVVLQLGLEQPDHLHCRARPRRRWPPPSTGRPGRPSPSPGGRWRCPRSPAGRPAITMPSAKRSATTVVPWRTCGDAGDGRDTGAVGCTGTRSRRIKSGEIGPGVFGCGEQRQRHRGYSPPFWT